MKLKLQLIIESDSGQPEVVHEVTKLERRSLRPETLGLTLSEAKELLREVQRAMVTHQTIGTLPNRFPARNVERSNHAKGSIRSCCGRSSASCDLIVHGSTIVDVAARRTTAASVRLQSY